MKLGERRPLTLAQQFVNLKSNPVCAGHGHLRCAHLIWRYEASPSPLSRLYGIRIELMHELSPRIFVESPDLQLLAGGRRLPHVYDQNPPRLCLYLPRAHEWQPWMRLDQTIVPWTALWFFYFEEWLASDEWKGGGSFPSDERRHRRARGSRKTSKPGEEQLP
ncbi:hypothetical protein [Methylovirgula sp. HY1]|uniref:hypothetical protein n=1 Tax=Methylovirgula sp. HY1 TaxID=2822761 RepID=UPI001C5AE687|nr:hypothetical protein [Methylovirgula sp. HY1]